MGRWGGGETLRKGLSIIFGHCDIFLKLEMSISFKSGQKLVYFQQALLGVGDERVEEDMLQDGLTPF